MARYLADANRLLRLAVLSWSAQTFGIADSSNGRFEAEFRWDGAWKS